MLRARMQDPPLSLVPRLPFSPTIGTLGAHLIFAWSCCAEGEKAEGRRQARRLRWLRWLWLLRRPKLTTPPVHTTPKNYSAGGPQLLPLPASPQSIITTPQLPLSTPTPNTNPNPILLCSSAKRICAPTSCPAKIHCALIKKETHWYV